MKKVVQRTCIGCNTKKDKKELIRIVINKEENVFIDETGKLEGRGAYLCDNIECLEQAIKAKRIEKKFNVKINKDFCDSIRGVIIERKNKHS